MTPQTRRPVCPFGRCVPAASTPAFPAARRGLPGRALRMIGARSAVRQGGRCEIGSRSDGLGIAAPKIVYAMLAQVALMEMV